MPIIHTRLAITNLAGSKGIRYGEGFDRYSEAEVKYMSTSSDILLSVQLEKASEVYIERPLGF